MIHLPPLINDLALILCTAAVVMLLFKRIKQPVVLGYIIAGLLVGPYLWNFPTVVEIESIRIWADIGVIFLMFGLGLEFSFKKLLRVGGVALVTAITEITMTMLAGYALGSLLGWNTINSLFLGGILAIASTTIILRAFDEGKLKDRKFAGIVMGVLVIEDLAAVILLVLLSTVSVSKSIAGEELLMSVLKLAFFITLWFISGIFFLPTFLKKIKKLLNEEMLLIISLALCLLMVVLASRTGFSSALGAFIMGSVLAETTKAEKISHITRSVKDLFGAIFFVSVGMLINPRILIQHTWIIIAATAVLLFIKPFFTAVGAILAGQPLRIAVQSGMSLSQIGEFSFIIATLGLSLKVTNEILYPVAVAVSVITTFTTPYMIGYSDRMVNGLNRILPSRLLKLLEEYSVESQNIVEKKGWRKVIRSFLVNVVLFSVIIISIILLSTEVMVPLTSNIGWDPVFSLGITLVILSPFLWGLAFRRTQRQAYADLWQKTRLTGPLVILQTTRIFLAIFYLGFLFDRYYSPGFAFAGVVVSLMILLLFSKKIRSFYGRLEERFLQNYNERELNKNSVNKALAPWDSHITTLTLGTNCMFIGKTLLESRIRENFGVNIVGIERGEYEIGIPEREERLYPNDKLTVIGTDEQLERFRKYIESDKGIPEILPGLKPVSLHHFTIHKYSPLIGKTIRESGIRERSKGIVIGVERRGERILNPESNLIFELDDKIWIVGNDKRIQVLIREYVGYERE